MANVNTSKPRDAEKLSYLQKKIQSALQDRSVWEQQWQKNYALYMGDHKNALEFTGMYFYAMMNLTAQVIDTKAAHLNSNPVRPVIVPRDNNEPVEWYFSNAGMSKAGGAMPQIQAMGIQVSMEQVQGTEHMDEETVNNLRTLGFLDTDFVKLDDDLVSDAITQELESQWILDEAEQWLSANNSDKLVVGQSDAIVQWDALENRVHFETLYPYDVFIDPTADSFSRANWIAYRELLTKSEAKERWPDLKDDIEGNKFAADATNVPQGIRHRKMIATDDDRVVHWTLWERHAEIEMSEDEANAGGHVQMVDGKPMVDGAPLEEDGSNWPRKSGIRQMELLGDIVLFDGESPFGGIPVDRNYNVRAVSSAAGIGDPQRLADLQDLINRVLSQFAENIAQYRSPMLAMPESVFSALESELKRAFSIAGMKLPVPDDSWEMSNGNIIKEITPPQIPDSAVQLFSQLVNQFFRLAGLPSALRGDTQSGTSGRAMEISTSNAAEPIAQVSRHTEMFLRKLLHTAVYLIIEYLPTEVFCERNKRFEPHVFEAMREKIRRVGYDVDVQVSGTNRQDQEAQRLIAAAHNVPILWQSPTFAEALLKKLGLPDAAQIASELNKMQNPQQQQLTAPQTPPMMNATGSMVLAPGLPHHPA